MERKLTQKPTTELALSATAVATIAVLWGLYMAVSLMPEVALIGPFIIFMGAIHLVHEKWGVAAIVYEKDMCIKIGKVTCSINDNIVMVGTSVFFQSTLDPDRFIHLDSLYLDEKSLYYLGTVLRSVKDKPTV